MGIVDLRHRGDEPEVEALVARARSGSPRELSGDDRPPLIGWTEDDVLVGCLAVERGDERELRLHDVFVDETCRGRGIGRALVEAVVAGGPVERFVVPRDERTDGFFARCGFEESADGMLVRTVAVEPASAAIVAAVTLTDLEAAIQAGWGRDTSADPDEWSRDNPARGQCDATAVVVRSYLGGEILVADVLREGRRVERHAWNRLPSGLTLDLTRDQLRGGEQLGEPTPQEPLLLGNASERHTLLAERVRLALDAIAG